MKKFTSYFMIFTIIIIVLNIIDFPIEIRFQNSSLNYLFVMILSILLPLSIFFKAIFNEKKIQLIIIAFVVAFPSYIVFVIAQSCYQDIKTDGINNSFKQLQEIPKNHKYYRLYLTDGGATTAQGIELREETVLPLGLKLISPIFKKYKAKEASIKFIAPNTLKIEIQPYSKGDKIYIKEIEI
jgi:Ca2+/Na+ antiporter